MSIGRVRGKLKADLQRRSAPRFRKASTHLPPIFHPTAVQLRRRPGEVAARRRCRFNGTPGSCAALRPARRRRWLLRLLPGAYPHPRAGGRGDGPGAAGGGGPRYASPTAHPEVSPGATAPRACRPRVGILVKWPLGDVPGCGPPSAPRASSARRSRRRTAGGGWPGRAADIGRTGCRVSHPNPGTRKYRPAHLRHGRARLRVGVPVKSPRADAVRAAPSRPPRIPIRAPAVAAPDGWWWNRRPTSGGAKRVVALRSRGLRPSASDRLGAAAPLAHRLRDGVPVK